jgi:hypothetical protein
LEKVQQKSFEKSQAKDLKKDFAALFLKVGKDFCCTFSTR